MRRAPENENSSDVTYVPTWLVLICGALILLGMLFEPLSLCVKLRCGF